VEEGGQNTEGKKRKQDRGQKNSQATTAKATAARRLLKATTRKQRRENTREKQRGQKDVVNVHQEEDGQRIAGSNTQVAEKKGQWEKVVIGERLTALSI